MKSLIICMVVTGFLLLVIILIRGTHADEPPLPQNAPLGTPADRIEAIRAKREVPALFAGKFYKDGRKTVIATGLRKVDAETPVTADDLIHLGSCTKAITAVMIAQLVTEKKLRWETTLGELFPEALAGHAGATWSSVTIEKLLWHESGAPANAPWHSLHQQHPDDIRASREALVAWLAEQPRPKNEKYIYSNVGYALLGHAIESMEDETWETVVQRKVFQPLQIESAGFGPVVGAEELDQPWGHSISNPLARAVGRVAELLAGQSLPAAYSASRIDNAPPLGPAGRVHMRLTDWAKFVALFATKKTPDSKLGIDAASWRKLLAPSANGNYAGGWVLAERDWAEGAVLNHAGSNTTWYCVAWVAPKKEFFVLAATNCYSEQAKQACDAAVGYLIAEQ
jgi:CubicO group peptidase (beta-lactamase class C family)